MGKNVLGLLLKLQGCPFWGWGPVPGFFGEPGGPRLTFHDPESTSSFIHVGGGFLGFPSSLNPTICQKWTALCIYWLVYYSGVNSTSPNPARTPTGPLTQNKQQTHGNARGTRVQIATLHINSGIGFRKIDGPGTWHNTHLNPCHLFTKLT